MNIESELSDIDDDSIDANAYLQVATVANSTLKRDLRVEDLDPFTLVSSLDNNTGRTLWQDVKECEPRDAFLWCVFDSLSWT